MIKEKLKKVKIFQALNEKELQKILNISVLKTFSRENILFYEGEMPQYFYVLLDGHVKFYKNDLKGAELVLHYFTQPLLMAEMPTLENIPFRATAIAMKDKTEVLLINRKEFINLLKEHTDLPFDVIKSLTKKIRELEIAINRNLIYDATTKVCSFILENPQDLIKSKQKEIANILSMAPETLSRVLRKLKKMEILNKDCKVINKEKLQMFLEF
ncbi:MAG: Transcriptional regulator, Crp/Fnr family [uncultured Sulfurovum sp.]|uniref:Transcriptional regulator, Crp/Fnr family n=1 Tax=uncultured Sulfurovum sp. TaxID=269237 RepID=A0A6S6T2X1_9BACT|nr:MAG: Transcriptional regulator, Crp/Fnr family [uncultured Sulfurovum sp.]